MEINRPVSWPGNFIQSSGAREVRNQQIKESDDGLSIMGRDS
jgi:hypothetical protein